MLARALSCAAQRKGAVAARCCAEGGRTTSSSKGVVTAPLRLPRAANHGHSLSCWVGGPAHRGFAASFSTSSESSSVTWVGGRPQVVKKQAVRKKEDLAGKWVLGCGSSWLERTLVVDSLPALPSGSSGRTSVRARYYDDQPYHSSWEETDVGGVTLAQLSWAAVLTVPTAMLGFIGADAAGKAVRACMAHQGASSPNHAKQADAANAKAAKASHARPGQAKPPATQPPSHPATARCSPAARPLLARC